MSWPYYIYFFSYVYRESHSIRILVIIRWTKSRQCAAAKQLVLSLGSLQMAVGGKCLHFLKAVRWVWCGGTCCVSHPPTPPARLSVTDCRPMALPLAPERGNRSVQPFTSPTFRLTESIRQDRPPPLILLHHHPTTPSSLLLHFCHLCLSPNYFTLGCLSCFLARCGQP